MPTLQVLWKILGRPENPGSSNWPEADFLKPYFTLQDNVILKKLCNMTKLYGMTILPWGESESEDRIRKKSDY
jgi:hypothetical protein